MKRCLSFLLFLFTGIIFPSVGFTQIQSFEFGYGLTNALSVPQGKIIKIHSLIGSSFSGRGITYSSGYYRSVDEYLNKANPLLSDTDGDGQNDSDEIVAGTDLNNPHEFFGLDCMMDAAGNGFVFSWLPPDLPVIASAQIHFNPCSV